MTARGEYALVANIWFDGDHLHDNGPTTFRIRDGRVADIAPGDHGTDLTRCGLPTERCGFLLPGLVDAHVHLFLDGAPTDSAVRAQHLRQDRDSLLLAGRTSARRALSWGVTLVRDAGDRHGINNQIRDEARPADSSLAGVLSGGIAIKRPRRYGSFMATDVDDADSLWNAITGLAVANDEVKLILTGIIDFVAGAVTDEPQFSLEEVKLAVTTARRLGRRTFAHCSGRQGLLIAARAGVGSIEHGFFMDREILTIMADHRVAWTPTFSPVHFQWAHPEAAGWSPDTVGNLRRLLDNHAEHLRLARELGVTLLLGTDAGSMGVEHGRAVHQEIERYLEAGLPMTAALQAATANARRHFGDPYPILARGAPFDAVLLDGNPLQDPAALAHPRRVVRSTTGCPPLNALPTGRPAATT